jgi:integrase
MEQITGSLLGGLVTTEASKSQLATSQPNLELCSKLMDALMDAGRAIGLPFNLGWHTLRHSYKSLLDWLSEDASLKRDLMRHADVHTTMQTYGEVEMDRLRVANNAAVALALTES